MECGCLAPAPYRPGPAQRPQIPPPAAADPSPAAPGPTASIAGFARHCPSRPPAFPASSRQRIHSSCFSRTPFAAADSGSNASFTSTHAHARPSAVRPATNWSARLVRPDDAVPVSSLIAPTGSPPSQQLVDSRNPRRRNLVHRARRRRQRRGKLVFQRALDLQTKCGGSRHTIRGVLVFSPFVRLMYRQNTPPVKANPETHGFHFGISVITTLYCLVH